MIKRSACFHRFIQSSKKTPPVCKIAASYFQTQGASTLQNIQPSTYSEDEYGDMDWDNLGFSLVQTDHMYIMKCSKDETFEKGKITPFGNIELSPSAGVLNYGQGIFEGTKAYRREDGTLFLFRPYLNAARMQLGAERMCMPSPSTEQFVEAVKHTALANKRWVPPLGKGALYMRPLLLGTGPILGLAPSPEYTFLVFASPVGNYFKEGTAPLNLYVEEEVHRAYCGGTGSVKTISNYGPILKALKRARDRGFSDVLYLDSVNKRYIEEVSSCNIFIVKGNVLSTPAARGNLLEGVTRRSIMDIANDLGYVVEEKQIPVEELMDADEVFCTGTAVGVAQVGSVAYKDYRVTYEVSDEVVSRKLYERLVGIQRGNIVDKRGWIVDID